MELALALDREKHPRPAGMKVEMARTEAQVAGRDRGEVGQHAVGEAEHLERAGLFGLVGLGVVAARHQDSGAVARRGPQLMGEDAEVEPVRLRDRVADRAVGMDAMHRDIARVIVRGQQVPPRAVDAAMHRSRRQRCGRAVRRQRAARRIDAERGRDMLGAGDGARPAVARHHIEIVLRRMRPGVLHVGAGRGDRLAPGQGRSLGVDVVAEQLRPDALVEHRLAHGLPPPERLSASCFHMSQVRFGPWPSRLASRPDSICAASSGAMKVIGPPSVVACHSSRALISV